MISPMRVSGLSGSGIDTDAAVKQMMAPYQAKVDSAKQDRDLLQVKQDMYRDITKDIKNLYSKYFDIASSSNSSTNILKSQNYQTVTYTSSNEGVITAKGRVGASTGTYQATVERLATPDKLNIPLTDLSNAGVLNFKFSDDPSAPQIDVDFTGLTSSTDITNAINSKISAYNSDPSHTTKIDVSVKYSELGNSVSIQRNSLGNVGNMYFKGTTAAFTAGQNSKVTIKDPSGNTATKEYSSNIFAIDGVEYTLNGVSSDLNSPTLLTGKKDTSAAINNIKSFVTDYNALIDKISTKLSEKLNRSYKPLTDDQKSSMKDSDIALWNDKVKQGQLRNDPTLSKIIEDVTNAFSTKIGSTLGSFGDIGLSLDPDYKTQKGKLVLDEDKLSTALTENGDKVKNLLTDTNTGAFQSLKDTFYNVAGSSASPLLQKAGYEGTVSFYSNDLTKSINEQQSKIDDMIANLSDREQAYYSKFAAFEQAMSKMQSQKDYFSKQFG
ncbi:flagellar hook-associated protein 2 [Clostridium cavendishii DSM 21758]|uniref:Flagellar hook-associated protein 2 n=1 Tax=Clostridium cavendishii DSM 21758 TaxID=1121302 RepID=A0A1M6B2A1_9CLOT|nr:flagellar filament capping protein FliD [Clostridium cavendishii]SHI42851.1 flagellar hook-associated protein 2 [Clostridium cavendishii DSM 21758]